MFTFDDRDQGILAARMASYDTIQGPRVGDFIRFTDGVLVRVSHVWEDGKVQTTDGRFGARFYLGDVSDRGAYISFSGGLDEGVWKNTLTQTEETMEGSVWFFHHGFTGGGRGVDTKATFRVFACSLASPKHEIRLTVPNALF
jgi:hypothetical protein